MIIVTGGAGFIGSATAAALTELGADCVRVHHRDAPGVERVDTTDLAAVLALGKRYDVTGIIHLAADHNLPADPTDRLDLVEADTRGTANVLRAALRWGVRRVSVASSLGLYDGATGTTEDTPLGALTNPIHLLKHRTELLGRLVPELEVVNLRISTVWGPGRKWDEEPLAALPAVHRDPTTPYESPALADDARDLCYVRDAAHGIALLQLADTLAHRTYNVGDGRATSNAEVAAAIEAAVPGASVRVRPGGGERSHLDLTRIAADTGYAPRYGLAGGIADWLDRL